MDKTIAPTGPGKNAPSLLDACPFCAYSLWGLPNEHRCPECGEEVDRRWNVFGGKSVWQVRRRGYELLVVTLIVGTAFSILFLGASWWRLGAIVRPQLIQLVQIIAPLLILRFIFRRPGAFIALGPMGIMLFDRRRKHREDYAWDRVGRADPGLTSVKIRIDGRERTLRGRFFNGSMEEPHELAKWINKGGKRE